MDLDTDLDLRWGDLHAPSKAFSEYGSINKVVQDLNTAHLRQYQRTQALKNGVCIERGIKNKYGKKTSILDKIKRYLNPHIDKAFGCLQRKIAPPSGMVVEDVTQSYVLNTTKKDFEYLDETIKNYYSKEPDAAYAVCYSFKRSPVEDIKTSYEILDQSYIKECVKDLTKKDIGSGVTHMMLTSDGESSSSKSLEEAHAASAFACSNISGDTFWLTGPASYKMMLKDLVWNRDIDKGQLYKMLKLIGSMDFKLDYWDKAYLKGHYQAEKVLKNLGKFCYENHAHPDKVEFLIDLTKLFPEKAHKIAEDIYDELSSRGGLSYFSFEEQAETIVMNHTS
ncbi:MAG: hypothetical protein R6W73_01515 [Candidatus Saliniplasma sp.]